MDEACVIPFSRIADDVVLDQDVKMVGFVNLYGCSIRSGTFIGPFVEVQGGVTIGRDCKIQSHSFICSGVTIEDAVFVGHGVMFTNDRYPRSVDDSGRVVRAEWTMEHTVVRRGANIGSGAVILPGLEIGAGATVGAGAVVTRSVEPSSVVAGVPAKQISPP